MTDHTQDVRELIAEEFARFLREEGARDRPWDFADGLVALVDPVIRGQERAAARVDLINEIQEMIRLRERAARATADQYPGVDDQRTFSYAQVAAYCELEERIGPAAQYSTEKEKTRDA